MPAWVTNEELLLRSDELADVMLTMLANVGIQVDIPGYDDDVDVDAVRESFWLDAADYTSMDPAKLEEEYNEILQTATHLFEHPEVTGPTTRAGSKITAWHGTAADAFADQMENIRSFATQQRIHTWFAAQAVSMMFALSVQFRASHDDLVEKTISVCRSMIASQTNSNPNWRSVLTDAVQGAVDILTMKAAGDLVKWGVDRLIQEVGTEDTPVTGDNERAVLDGYVTARDQLRKSYASNLTLVQEWVDARRRSFAELTMPLLSPLPTSTDVDSPDFRYEEFYYDLHDNPGVYAPEVERERTKYVEEKSNGLIGQRLDGEG